MSGFERAREDRKERGIALILCLLVLAILIVLVAQFTYSVQVEKTIAKNSKDDLKILFASRGAVALVKAHLRADRVKNQVDSLRDDWADEGLRQVRIGDVNIVLTLEDTERFLNVNLLADKETRDLAVEILVRLTARLEIENGEEIVQRIKDFVDEDSEGNFEAGARNMPLFHADELLGMAGLTPEIEQALAGKPANLAEQTEAKPGILNFLTASGAKKMNPNTIPLDLWHAIIPDTDVSGAAIDRDAALAEVDKFRTGAEESTTGTGTGTGSGTGTGTVTSGTTTETGEKPGQDFKTVDDVLKIQGLAKLFNQQQAGGAPPAGGQPGGGQPAGQQPPQKISLRRLLDVNATDFKITIDANRAELRKRYEVILRRGHDRFDVLLWREVTGPSVQAELAGVPSTTTLGPNQ